jgi:CDP-diacylglycerol--serine O-phosphatidyltransferase
VVRIRPEWILPTLVGVGVFVAALSSAPWHTLLALGAVYLASLPVGWWSAWRLSRRDAAARAATAQPETTAPHIVHFGGERDERESSRSKAR